MNLITSGVIAALFMAACMGATLKPTALAAARPRQAARLIVDPANSGLLASAVDAVHSAG